jgi:PIN domain nuclease of toxin-antitoxin system
MPSLVADTHAVVWYLLQSPRLSDVAREQMAAAIAGGDPILVPSICLVEIVYLVEKRRIPQAD